MVHPIPMGFPFFVVVAFLPLGGAASAFSILQTVQNPQPEPKTDVSLAVETVPPSELPAGTVPVGPHETRVSSTIIAYLFGGLECFRQISFAMVIKTLCMAGNVVVQVSPYPQAKRWASRGCTGEADAAPYLAIAFGGWQWCFYGTFAYILTKRSGFLILVHSNCLGAVLGTYYTVTFAKNCQNDAVKGSLHKYLSGVGAIVAFQVCSIFSLPAERALFLAGLISSFCSFAGAMSMLVTVPQVFRNKDSRSIPGPLVTANFFSAVVWCICGWMLEDPLVTIPNLFSGLSSFTCIYLKYKFPSSDEVNMKLPGPHKTKSIPAKEWTPLVRDQSTKVSGGSGSCSADTGGTF